VHLRNSSASQEWVCISGVGVHLRNRCASSGHLRNGRVISGIAVHLRYGRASQVWVCISGIAVHLRYSRAISGMGVYLKYGRAISGIAVHLQAISGMGVPSQE
jgi:hypothetical protein